MSIHQTRVHVWNLQEALDGLTAERARVLNLLNQAVREHRRQIAMSLTSTDSRDRLQAIREASHWKVGHQRRPEVEAA